MYYRPKYVKLNKNVTFFYLQKIREMEIIDKKRTMELEKRIAEEAKKKSKSDTSIPGLSVR